MYEGRVTAIVERAVIILASDRMEGLAPRSPLRLPPSVLTGSAIYFTTAFARQFARHSSSVGYLVRVFGRSRNLFINSFDLSLEPGSGAHRHDFTMFVFLHERLLKTAPPRRQGC